jgi:hypothetical protein
MNRILKYIIILTATVLTFSCSDEFVNEKLEVSGVATSAIIISPDWEAEDYQFQLKGEGDNQFRIYSKPVWLETNSDSGRFINEIATIQCKANTKAEYSKIGIYIDQILITSGSRKYAVPVYYLTEGNPSAQVNRTFHINYNSYNNQLEIANQGDGILIWDIVSMPNWLTVDMDQFTPSSLILGQGVNAFIPFILNAEKVVQNNLTGKIILKTNDKDNPQVEISVTADLGNPDLVINTYELPIDFGTKSTVLSLDLNNQGKGILTWKFDNLPEWLTVEPSSGIAYAYSSNPIEFNCDRSKLEPGVNTATIQLKSNDPADSLFAISVLARIPGDNKNVSALEGQVVDAMFDKNTNMLYYATSQPNKLVVFDVVNRTILHEINLGKAPTCFTISEDFTNALVGHGGIISMVNLNSQSVSKTINVSGVLNDIEYADNEWCAYTEGGNYNIQWTKIYWVNLTTGNTTKGSGIYEDCLIKKVPNQNYIIGSDTELSAGIYVYDTNNRSEKSKIFDFYGNFWFSGSYLINSAGNVHRIIDLVAIEGHISNAPSPVGSLEFPNDNFYDVYWLDYCDSTHSIFALKKQYYHTVSPSIYQFEDNDFTMTNRFYYDDLYQPNAQTAAYEVEARYLFSNSSGTELSVLRKGKDNNQWSVEFIQVEQ